MRYYTRIQRLYNKIYRRLLPRQLTPAEILTNPTMASILFSEFNPTLTPHQNRTSIFEIVKAYMSLQSQTPAPSNLLSPTTTTVLTTKKLIDSDSESNRSLKYSRLRSTGRINVINTTSHAAVTKLDVTRGTTPFLRSLYMGFI